MPVTGPGSNGNNSESDLKVLFQRLVAIHHLIVSSVTKNVMNITNQNSGRLQKY